MKKIINILLVIISILSFTIIFNITDSNQKNSTIYAENKGNSFRILIPDEISTLDKENAYNKIITIANKYNANLCTTHTETNNKIIYKKYVYINDSSYFKNFKTSKDKYIDFSMLGDNKFFSTAEKSDDPNQVATILDFANNDSLEIYSLKDSPVLSGFYIVSLSDSLSEDNFINDLSTSLGIQVVKSSNPALISDYSSI